MKSSKVLLNISAFFCYIYFALYIFTLVFIPIGVYCFLAGKCFAAKADNLEDIFKIKNETFRNYAIFASIFCFPFGLLSLIPYFILTSNHVKISNSDSAKIDKIDNEDKTFAKEENPDEQQTKDAEFEKTQTESSESEADKLEKLKKLENFRDKGLITDDELEQAREQMFGKKHD